MIDLDLKSYYSRFLEGHMGQLHFAAHSHHFWPDVSRDAQIEYWDDCARESDAKWGKIFSEVIPTTQGHIARLLKLKDPKQIVFAPNTHELVARLLTCLPQKVRIVTGTNEFHSWKRQYLRLSESADFVVETVDTSALLTDRATVLANLKNALSTNPDLFFLSQVFFDSGLALTDDEIYDVVSVADEKTIVVIDGYHGFAAIPIDLSKLEGRIFFVAGGYKYAQAGEGVAFMVVPKGDWRPANTGWFADYGTLSTPPGGRVGYADNAMAFMGATQDSSGLYRFNAVWDQFQQHGVTVHLIHDYVLKLQKVFLQHLPKEFVAGRKLKALFTEELTWHGHFLTFEAPDLAVAEELQAELKEADILIDRRALRLRFGFGTYQDEDDVRELCSRLAQI
jgi:selenocysteine lyase/cysteine desulfurase